MPVRRASSLVPISPSASPSPSSTSSARSTAPMRRAPARLLPSPSVMVRSILLCLQRYCPGGKTHDAPVLVRLRRHRRRHPRPLDRLPPRARARGPWPRRGLRHRRPRQALPRRRRVRHRVRRGAQQLLPAGDERADGRERRGVGVRPGRVRLQLRRLHRARRAGAGVRPHRGLRAPAAHRVRVRADPRRGRGRRAHEGDVPRLAGQGRHRLPARAQGRVRVQRRLDQRPRREVPVEVGARPLGCRGDGLHVPRRRLRQRRRDEPGHDRGRRAGRRRARPLGEDVLVDARACPTRSTSTPRRATSRRTSRCGRTGTCRRARSRSTRASSRCPTARCRRSSTSTPTLRSTPTTACS